MSAPKAGPCPTSIELGKRGQKIYKGRPGGASWVDYRAHTAVLEEIEKEAEVIAKVLSSDLLTQAVRDASIAATYAVRMHELAYYTRREPVAFHCALNDRLQETMNPSADYD